jgi:hypothetical protein
MDLCSMSQPRCVLDGRSGHEWNHEVPRAMIPHPTAMAPNRSPLCTSEVRAAALLDCTAAAEVVAVPGDRTVADVNPFVVESTVVFAQEAEVVALVMVGGADIDDT